MTKTDEILTPAPTVEMQLLKKIDQVEASATITEIRMELQKFRKLVSELPPEVKQTTFAGSLFCWV